MDLNERAATGVKFDPVRGHITINPADGPPLVTMVDTGQRLEVWSGQGAHLSPEVACQLADALLQWGRARGHAPGRADCSTPYPLTWAGDIWEQMDAAAAEEAYAYHDERLNT